LDLFIDKDFSYYGLKEFEPFIELINICAVDTKLYRLLPFLLRNLFENLLYYIFRDSLSPIHTELFFDRHQRRSRDFSELITLLKVLKDDPEISKYHKNSITERTIEYLSNVREDGNLDVHRIVTEISKYYPSEKKSEINTLLESILSFYNAIKGQKLSINNTKTHVKLARELGSSIPNQNAREIINELKILTKEEMGDLIVEIEADKLIEVIEKMIAEIKLLEDFEESQEKQYLYQFIEYSIRVRDEVKDKKNILQKVMNLIISERYGYKTKFLYEKLPIFLETPEIKDLFVKEYVQYFISFLYESKSYNESGTNSEILYLLKEGIEKSSMDKIIDATLNNEQINKSSKAKRVLNNLFAARQDIFDFKSNQKLEKFGMGIPEWMIL